VKRFHVPFIAFAFLAVGCGDDSQTPPGKTDRHLVLLHTNDEHSHLFAFGPEIDDWPTHQTPGNGTLVGGVARRATVLAKERMAAQAAHADSLTVSAGDETQGALPEIAFATTSPDLSLMKSLGYDVMCPGNHEFDLGPGGYARAIMAAQAHGGLPPIVSTNIHFSATDAGDDMLEALYGEGTSQKPIKRYHVLTTPSGIKVGFLGIMGPNASFYAPLKLPVTFSGNPADEGTSANVLPILYDDIRPTISDLRDVEHVDVVVALSHSGVDPARPSNGDDYQIASNVAGIDVLISAHTHDALDQPMMVAAPDGYMVPIVQAGAFGQYVGRVEVIVPAAGGRPQLSAAGTRLVRVDDTTTPTLDVVGPILDGVVRDLETSFLPAALTRIEGTTVTDDPAQLGDLYFRPEGATGFDVVGLVNYRETALLNLATDAVMKSAEDTAGPTMVAVQAAGTVRADILRGATGVLTFADLFRTFPLGQNPTDGSVGYPLVRFYIYLAEVKAAMEVSASRGLINAPEFLSVSGLHVEFDTSRPAQVIMNSTDALNPQNGRVTKITLDTDHSDGYDNPTLVIFDLARADPWTTPSFGNAFTLIPLVTDLYVASFASTAGVTLKDMNGNPLTLEQAILHRTDGSDIKAYEAFIGYIRTASMQNGGTLPARYDASTAEGHVPRRMLCTGPLCPQ
jgi:2',3'-cyclic-nucleotide 2'-phosphodiesterase (5'-nucleotidase family)